MRALFPQYKDLVTEDYIDAWKQALFVFDTNVLLNIYRYHSGTRDELLNVLEQLADRIWIPHHVALEFQRNRLKVIAEQGKQLSEIHRTIENSQRSLFADLEKLQLNKRHSLINPEPLQSGFNNLVNDFLKELNRLQESQQKLTEPDPLKAKIETLFDKRVGDPPLNQEEIDKLYKEAEQRYKLKIPPGYKDTEKDKDGADEHKHGGIIYKRKYGDYLVWHQLLTHAKNSNSKAVIFVTDDGKEDWWRKVDFNGQKTIGPRPELIEEASLHSQVDTLLMYNPEGFLKYAKTFLEVQVSENTLKEVRDVSKSANLRNSGFREFRVLARAKRAVMQWLLARFSFVQENQRGFPDFIVEEKGNTFGFEMTTAPIPEILINRLRETINRFYYELSGFSVRTFVLVTNSPPEADELLIILRRAARNDMPDNLRLIVGVYKDIDNSGGEFVAYEDIVYSQANKSI